MDVSEEVQGSETIQLPMSDHDLLEAVTKFIRFGSSSLDPKDLEAAQDELASRLAQAESIGFTKRDVVLAVLDSVFSQGRPCGCPLCRERCLGCRYS